CAERVSERHVDAAAQAAERLELLPTVEAIRESEIARQITDAAASADAFSLGVEPEDRRPPSGWSDQAEEETDRRALARAVRTQVAEHLARLDPEIEAVERP